MKKYTLPFNQISMTNLGKVGGKNASLGEMIMGLKPLGISVPDGYAITVDAFYDFLSFNSLSPRLQAILNRLNRMTLDNLAETGSACRELIMNSVLPEDIQQAVRKAHNELMEKNVIHSVAVRSSATAEDSPTASFAGQHDSFLNVTGVDHVLESLKKCYASFFNDRAIKYRLDNGFSDLQVGLSVGVQLMIRSDKGSAGVIFTIEPETGNNNLIYITGAWGLGEAVVQGAVNTDEFYVFKPALQTAKSPVVYRLLGAKDQMVTFGRSSDVTTETIPTPPSLRDQFVLNDEELTKLARWSAAIESHYGMPMDIEWAKDGITGEIFIVQARPETIHSHNRRLVLKEYALSAKADPILKGKAIGRSIVSGRVSIVKSLADNPKVKEGDIIVADITNPDWNALLRKAVCIVTNKGGRTSHASIVARELGIPAVVGTLSATEKLTDGQIITVSCVSGDEGFVYDGKLQWMEKDVPVKSVPRTRTRPMFILADAQKSLLYATYPSHGVGLLRMEFMISNSIQIHPMALVKFKELADNPEKKQIAALTRHYTDKKQFFVEKLADSISLVAAAFYPREVIVRMSDFKTNEYAKLLGGKMFEPDEENPMLGFRGASRYYHEKYREGFGLECAAIRRVRDEMQLKNVKVMIPFCRTIDEAKQVLRIMAMHGLERKVNGLEVYVMAEIPSNILLADKFSRLFDGFSIGSNDLTQLTLGLDRDSAIVSQLFDESNEAVTQLISHLVEVAHSNGVAVGLCGQAPSDRPEFARFLVKCGIDSISFNPDALLRGIQNIAAAEQELNRIPEETLSELNI